MNYQKETVVMMVLMAGLSAGIEKRFISSPEYLNLGLVDDSLWQISNLYDVANCSIQCFDDIRCKVFTYSERNGTCFGYSKMTNDTMEAEGFQMYLSHGDDVYTESLQANPTSTTPKDAGLVADSNHTVSTTHVANSSSTTTASMDYEMAPIPAIPIYAADSKAVPPPQRSQADPGKPPQLMFQI